MRAEIRIAGQRVVVRQNGTTVEQPLATVVGELVRLARRRPSCPVLPAGVRSWIECGDVTAVAVELPPQARMVRWLAAGSQLPFGRGARYERYFIGFPYIVLLLVFRQGELTGYQQLFYRTAPLDEGEELLLPNLLNVAEAYGQKSWLCLANLRGVSRLPWPAKIRSVVEHVFGASFNRSSEMHEMNSLWGTMVAAKIDPRVSSVEAWQEATRANPRFALEVSWRPAGTTMTAELETMFREVAGAVVIDDAERLGALVALLSGRGSAR
jgi:hypothetical protein